MGKPEQVLTIEPPNELRFRGPFTNPVTSYMKLTNPTDKKVCFKIKTTAPKKYCVRPNSGVMEPKSIVDIAVSLQPLDFDPSDKKHKFMVLTTIPPDGINLENVWDEVKPDNLMDSKLKCVFEMPVDTNSTAGDSDETLPIQEKVKWTNDMKVSSKPGTEFPPEVAKVSSEVKNVKTDDSIVRQENVVLKEEVMLLRHLLQQTETKNAEATKLGLHGTAPCANIIYIIIAIGVGMFGFLLGKFIV